MHAIVVKQFCISLAGFMLSETGQVQGSWDSLQRDPDARPWERVRICRWYDHCLIMALHYSLADRLHAFLLKSGNIINLNYCHCWMIEIDDLSISWPFCTSDLWFSAVHFTEIQQQAQPIKHIFSSMKIGLIYTSYWRHQGLGGKCYEYLSCHIFIFIFLWRWNVFQI